MATQLKLAHLIVLATAGGAAFYGSSRLATTNAADGLSEPVVRTESARTAAASAESGRAEPAPKESVPPESPSTDAAAASAAPGETAQSSAAPGDAVPSEQARIATADSAVSSTIAAPVAGARARAPIEVNRNADAFPSVVWTPPPPPPPPPAPPPPPPPPPTAPSLPFRFVGMIEQKTDRPTAFLAKGDALHVVGVGDVVDSTYRIESLSSTQIVVTYLPLNQRQSLSVDGGQK